jgi:excinuclease ABC subunit A
MKQNFIKIINARTNNLKSVSINIPLNKLVCVAGPSGSGKTSLAFDTIYSESKRRFLNSFPNYIKFFSERPAPVDVDLIDPVLPVFGLPQINPIIGSRTTVVDSVGLTQIFQSYFYQYATELCPKHHCPLESINLFTKIKAALSDDLLGEKYGVYISSNDFINNALEKMFLPSRSIANLSDIKIEDFNNAHLFWELLRFKNDLKLKEKLTQYNNLNINLIIINLSTNKITKLVHENGKQCPECDYRSEIKKTPFLFSPYNAVGACRECKGHGSILEYSREKYFNMERSILEGGLKILEYKPFSYEKKACLKMLKKYKVDLALPIKKMSKTIMRKIEEGEDDYCGVGELFRYLETKRYKPNVRIFIRSIQDERLCMTCEGSRIDSQVSNFYLYSKYKLKDIYLMKISDLLSWAQKIKDDKKANSFESGVLKKIIGTLIVAVEIGLGHLALSRKTKSVSPGEYQRLLMLKYLSFEGTNSLFIFDEPSLGLSEVEQEKVIKALRSLLKQGNSVIVIDHAKKIFSQSDYFIEMGPGAGYLGGEIIFEGKYLQSPCYKEHTKINFSTKKKVAHNFIKVSNSNIYQRTFCDYQVALNAINWVTGPSGSGKTSALVNILGNYLFKKTHKEDLVLPVGHAEVSGKLSLIEDVLVISSSLNKFSSRSSVGSMTDLASVIRKRFSKLPVAKSLGLVDGHFSPNSELGRCPTCEGKGHITVEMQFLEDIELLCEDCKGLKIKPIYANISDGEILLTDCYRQPIREVFKNWKLTPKYRRILDYLEILNLDYLSIDRSLNSLSGGERQRIFLLSKLIGEVKNSLIIFENLSFGLSDRELLKIIYFLENLRHLNNTLVVIDQNPIFAHFCDHQIKFKHK